MLPFQLIELIQSWRLELRDEVFELIDVGSEQFDFIFCVVYLSREILDGHYKLLMLHFRAEILLLILKILYVAALFVEVLGFD